MMSGEFDIEGDMQKLLQYSEAAVEMTETGRGLDTSSSTDTAGHRSVTCEHRPVPGARRWVVTTDRTGRESGRNVWTRLSEPLFRMRGPVDVRHTHERRRQVRRCLGFAATVLPAVGRDRGRPRGARERDGSGRGRRVHRRPAQPRRAHRRDHRGRRLLEHPGHRHRRDSGRLDRRHRLR